MMSERRGDAARRSVFPSASSGRAKASVLVSPFLSLYRQYFGFVWSAARRLGVELEAMDDVVQQVFMVIHAKLDTLEKPEALRSWIYSIVRRTVRTHRRATHARITGLESEIDAASPEPTPLARTETNRELQLLQTLLAELDEPKREVFALVELEELTVPEVADVLEIPLNTAYSRLRAARQAFEAALARHEARSKGK
jgi:RNA polymerase sigma-70 factor, ECF subfamily